MRARASVIAREGLEPTAAGAAIGDDSLLGRVQLQQAEKTLRELAGGPVRLDGVGAMGPLDDEAFLHVAIAPWATPSSPPKGLNAARTLGQVLGPL